MPETEEKPILNGAVKEANEEEEEEEEATFDSEVNGVESSCLTKEDAEKEPVFLKDDDDFEWTFEKCARNRVKLYVLCEQRVWDDRGTGHVACMPLPDNSGFHAVVVRLETVSLEPLKYINDKNVLESRIMMDTIYQKQQETLIVWSESENTDLALSFQEKSGCEELWNKICEVQGKDPKEYPSAPVEANDDDDCENSEGSNDRSAAASRQAAAAAEPFSLPTPDLVHLTELELLFCSSSLSGIQKEKFAAAIEKQGFIAKFCDLFRMCEDLEHERALKSIYNICRAMFTINRSCVVETMVNEEFLNTVVGMLEYDPMNEPRVLHREFLYEKSKFKEILPLENKALKDKIHQAFRVQYVQDVCLPAPSLFEENHLTVLNSYLFFLRVDIVTMVHENEGLMRQLFTELSGPATSVKRRKELAAFLRELISMSGVLQQNSGPGSKEAFYKQLLAMNVLDTIEPALQTEDTELKATMVEVLQMMSDYSPQVVRDYILLHSRERQEPDMLMNILLRHMVTDRDPELTSAGHMLQVLRQLLDPDHMPQKGEKNDFLNVFYGKCLPGMAAYVLDSVSGMNRPRKDDYHSAKKMSLVVRLFIFCVTHHALPMRTFVIRRDFLNKVLVLLSSRHHFLALYALKMLRSVMMQKDEYYNNYLCEKNVFDKVVECLVDNGSRNNLLNSAVIELFDFMRTEDMKSLIGHVVERHYPILAKHDYVKTFDLLKDRHDQYKSREETMRRAREESSSQRKEEARMKREKEREIEKEEQWFDDDEEEEEEEKDKDEKLREERSKAPGPSPGRKSGAEPMYPKAKKADDEDTGVFSGGALKLAGAAAGAGGASTLANTPKIVIKMTQGEGSRSRSPSPGSVPREDEVTSSQASSSAAAAAAAATGAAATSPAPSSPTGSATSPNPIKGLVEYDDSDSDDEERNRSGGSSGSSGDDAVPSSSTGSPTEEEKAKEKRKRRGERSGGEERGEEDDEEDDVSSTSGEDDSAASTPAPDAAEAGTKKSRKRESADNDDVAAGDSSGKRIRVDEEDTIAEEEVAAAAADAAVAPPTVDAQ